MMKVETATIYTGNVNITDDELAELSGTGDYGDEHRIRLHSRHGAIVIRLSYGQKRALFGKGN